MLKLFWILSSGALIFIPAVVLSFLGLISRPAGEWMDGVLMFSFACAVTLVIWMFVSCVRNASLNRRERLRWELLLLIGGPITAMIYLYRELSEPTFVADQTRRPQR